MNIDSGWFVWVVVVITALLGTVFATSKKQEIAGRSKWLLAIPLLAVGIIGAGLQFGFFTDLGFSPLSSGVEPVDTGAVADNVTLEIPTTPSGVSSVCQPGSSVSKTTIKLSAANAVTLAAAGGTHAYKVSGGSVSTVADGGTFDSSPGTTIEYLLMNESNTATYLGKKGSFTVPCSGTYELTQPDAKGFVPGNKIYANGSLTMDLFNRDGNSMAAGVNNQSMTTNDDFKLALRFTAPSEAGFEYGGVVIFEGNATAIDFSKLQLLDSAGNELPSATISSSLKRAGATERALKLWSVPGMISNAEYNYKIRVVAPGNNQPDTGVMSGGFNVSFQPKAPSINDGVFADPAIEDEDNRYNYLYQPTINGYLV